MAIVHFDNDTKVSVVCEYCFSRIDSKTRIRCLNCKKDCCFECFEEEYNTHYEHKIKVVQPTTKHEGWGGVDNYLFFEGLIICGIGNFDALDYYLPHIVSEKSRAHFNDVFEIDEMEPVEKELPKISNPNFHEVWSFMPLRQDFEIFYREDFEGLIKDIKIENVGELESGQKEIEEEMFEIYRTVLHQRNYKETFLINRNILGLRKMKEKIKNMPATQSKFFKQLLPLAGILSKSDFNTFLNGLWIEEELKNKKYCVISDEDSKLCQALDISHKELCKVRKLLIKGKFSSVSLQKIFKDKEEKLVSVYKYFIS